MNKKLLKIKKNLPNKLHKFNPITFINPTQKTLKTQIPILFLTGLSMYIIVCLASTQIINIKKARNLITMINDARPKENTFLKKKALWAKKNIKKGQELTLSYPHYNPAAKKTRKKR